MWKVLLVQAVAGSALTGTGTGTGVAAAPATTVGAEKPSLVTTVLTAPRR